MECIVVAVVGHGLGVELEFVNDDGYLIVVVVGGDEEADEEGLNTMSLRYQPQDLLSQEIPAWQLPRGLTGAQSLLFSSHESQADQVFLFIVCQRQSISGSSVRG